MARGLPAVWSTVLGFPFVGGGAYVYGIDAGVVPDFGLGLEVPPEFGLPFALFGGFVIAVGLYVQTVAPEGITLRDDEEVVDVRNPTTRVAGMKIASGIPPLAVGTYLLLFTRQPYVYPLVALLVGLYLFSSGLYVYWTNTLTTYYVTTQRFVREYRFLSLIRQELPWNKVRGVRQSRSPAESMVGLGNVRVASGGGDLEIAARDIEDATAFANAVRDQYSE